MEQNYKLIPELRFPEFVNDGEWRIEKLSKTCDVFRGGVFSKADILENGSKNCIHYGELFTKYNEVVFKIISKTNKDDGFKSKTGDILMPSSDVTPTGLAKASAIMVDDVVLGGDMNILRPKIDINSIFLSYLLNYSKEEIIKLVSGTTVKHIYPSQIINCLLPIIDCPSEQQKIADCLSSLDELITLHNDKLESLKKHKKGLLQNLFPQEAQKVPNYRFSEFANDGEWKEKILGEIGSPLMCKRIFKEETTINKSDIPFYKIGTFGKQADSFISKELYERYKRKFSFPKKGDVLISASGTIGRLVVYNGDPAYFQDSNIVWLDNDESQVINSFLFYSYLLLKWKTSDGGIIQRLYNTDLKNMKIIFPNNKVEQQKIAKCLITIDSLITTQTEKIEQLKAHKKGLIQGLFPKITA